MSNQSLLYLTPKASFYNKKSEVITEGRYLHTDTLNADRTLYTYLLYFLNSTYYSKSLIIENLLTNSLHKKENASLLENDPKLLEIENKLIHRALFNENITHALKMLLQLKNSRINNSRTKRIIVDFIFNRGNADRISIKYKKKIKDLLIHAYGLQKINDFFEDSLEKFERDVQSFNNPFAVEVLHFVFDKKYNYTSPMLNEYIRVRDLFIANNVNAQTLGKTDVPFEVLVGFNNLYKRNVDIVTLITKGNVSEKQAIQLQNTVKRHSDNQVELKIDFSKYNILDLYKYLFGKKEVSTAEEKEILDLIKSKASELRSNLTSKQGFENLEDMAIILDASESHLGSKETHLHPMLKNLTLLSVLGTDNNVFFAGGEKLENGLIKPSGESNLTQPLLEAVKAGFTKVIILSDGFENVYSVDQVYNKLKELGYPLEVIHFNPVFSPKNFSFKTLGDNIVTVPFMSEKDLDTLFLFYLLEVNKESFKAIMRKAICEDLQIN